MRRLRDLPLLLFLAPLAAAAPQNGDRAGEDQPPLPADLVIPPAPVLSPAEQLETFRLPPGFKIELVAAEPLVVDPVAINFDATGRLWVVEMRGYMPNIEGTNEREPIGCIAVLTDTDGDGRMDERVDFMDELVLPRAVLPMRDGALVIAPPELLFCRDTDGDGKADTREVIDTRMGGLDNPEHAINALLPTLDNWVRVANDRRRWRFRDGAWVTSYTNGGGQWGLTKDDVGRIFFNTNPDPLRGDLYPSTYALRNPSLGTAWGVNVRVAHDMETHPSRINPGVNRGYQKQTLRDDYTLHKFTGACGPHVYRGGALGADVQGDAFVCEPTGNLVKRYDLSVKDGIVLEGRSINSKYDFLTSTDERFRPVNLCDGPDGGLYIADFARGLIQHRIFLTSFLRKQIEERGLEGPMGLGRIWRVAPAHGQASRRWISLAGWSWTQLIAGLSDESGWVRDAAQRTIVDEWGDDAEVLGDLRKHALTADSALGRMHALWALEGIDWVTEGVVTVALRDTDPRPLHAAVRLSEPFLATGKSPDMIERLLVIGSDPDADARVRHQVLLSLGEARVRHADRALARLVTAGAVDRAARPAVVSGLYGRELEFLELLVSSREWSQQKEGRKQLVESLARCVAREGVSERIARLVALAADRADAPEWQTHYLMAGILGGRRRGAKGQHKPIRLTSEPAAYPSFARFDGTGLEEHARGAADALTWPGKPGAVEEEPVRPLTAAEHALFERGRATFLSVCSACHMPTGLGEPGKAPPLRYQEYVLGPEQRLVSILLHGLEGPLRIEGVDWNGEMPAFGASPEDIAGVATYIRREWGHGADPVTPETVRAIMELTKDRRSAWTAEELKE